MIKTINKNPQKNAQHFFAGFTLMEILLVISIMAVIFTMVISSISSYAARQEFKTYVVDVRDGIIEMRQKTLASINDTLYGIHVSSTAVTLFEGNNFIEGNADNIVIEFPGTITATTSFTGDSTTATFTRLTGVPSATGTIVLSDTRSNTNATVTISNSGLVK